MSKKLKVALIDNMNNNFFSFLRYLRDEGIDAHLYEMQKQKTFIPAQDTYDNVQNIEYIHDFPIILGVKSWIIFDKNILQETFKDYDFIISCGLSCAYFQKAGITIDMILPFGSDLYYMTNFPFNYKRIIRSLIYKNISKYQVRAFQNSRVVALNATANMYKEPLTMMNIVNLDETHPIIYSNENYRDIEKWNILNGKDFIVFNHSRHLWCSNRHNLEDFDKYKGLKRNDKIINAFAKFINNSSFKNPALILFENGYDIDCSKDLIKRLNIEQYVIWKKRMDRKEILSGLKYANFVFDQARENFESFGGTGYEALAMGVPLLAYINGSNLDKNHIYYKCPVLDILEVDDIVNIFKDYEINPNKYKQIGIDSKKWFDENLGIGLAKKYVKSIKLMVEDKSLTQNDKILRDIFENKD